MMARYRSAPFHLFPSTEDYYYGRSKGAEVSLYPIPGIGFPGYGEGLAHLERKEPRWLDATPHAQLNHDHRF